MKIREDLVGLAYAQGYRILSENGLAIVGMSPGNSHFTRETIDSLLRTTVANFSRVHVMIPDGPAIHTYLALGYEPIAAARKARLGGNTLRNHTKRSIGRITSTNPGAVLELLDWEKIETDGRYAHSFSRIQGMYASCKEFRRDARSATRKVLVKRMRHCLDTSVDKGVNYLLKELAFLDASPDMLETPTAYVYHRGWKIFECFIAGVYDGRPRNDLGFVRIS